MERQTDKTEWYELSHPDETDSPALLIFPNRIATNIQQLIKMAGGAARLMPHVKTHKMAEVVAMQVKAGIYQFKCATIAEAEMLAGVAGVKKILLAYQLTGPKALRFLQLVKKYPDLQLASLVDNWDSARMLNDLFEKEEIVARIFIDVDTGMHRTGIEAGAGLFELYVRLQLLKNTECLGLHVYDGHIEERDFELRRRHGLSDFEGVKRVKQQIIDSGLTLPKIIAGGSPTFPIHAMDKDLLCSPGTGLLWDYGYRRLLEEQPFSYAAVLLTRIISLPARGLVTTDLGYKSVASENPLFRRIHFLNLPGCRVHSQSEEHLVLEVENREDLHIGDVLYGIPYHVCPTVALYEEAFVVEKGKVVDKWKIVARNRKLSL